MPPCEDAVALAKGGTQPTDNDGFSTAAVPVGVCHRSSSPARSGYPQRSEGTPSDRGRRCLLRLLLGHLNDGEGCSLRIHQNREATLGDIFGGHEDAATHVLRP